MFPRIASNRRWGKREQLRAPARRARADDRAGFQFGDRGAVAADPDVARVGPFEKRGQYKPRRDERRYVFQTVDSDIDLTAGQRLFELFDEEALAADRRERDVLVLVAGRPDLDDRGAVSFGGELSRHFVRLPQRKLASAGANPEIRHRSPKAFLIVRRTDSRSAG
jgi:hypothetical protein